MKKNNKKSISSSSPSFDFPPDDEIILGHKKNANDRL